MKTLKIDGVRFEIPEEWGELSECNCRRIIRATSTIRNKIQVQAAIALEMLGLKVMPKKARIYDELLRKLRKATTEDPEEKRLYYIRHGVTKVCLISSADMALIASALDWLFTSPKDYLVTLKSQLIVNFQHTIKFGKRTYIGPASLFDGVRFWQFAEAETAWAQFADGDTSAARKAMAALYRLDGEPETSRATEQKQKDFARVGKEDLRLFSLYYEGAKLGIAEYYDDLFGPSGEQDESPFTGSSKPLPVRVHESFVDMTNLLTKLDTTKIEGIREAYLYDAFNTLRALKKTQHIHGTEI